MTLRTWRRISRLKPGIRLPPYVDWFCPAKWNRLTDGMDCEEAARVFLDMRNAVITGRAARYACGEGFASRGRFDIDAVDTTGSGDAFCAADPRLLSGRGGGADVRLRPRRSNALQARLRLR